MQLVKCPVVGLVVADAFSLEIITKAVITGPCLSLTGPAEEDPGNLPGPGAFQMQSREHHEVTFSEVFC